MALALDMADTEMEAAGTEKEVADEDLDRLWVDDSALH